MADVKRYKDFIYAAVGFSCTDMYLPSLWDKIRPSFILQSNPCHLIQKTAICIEQVAVFLLTIKLFFRLIYRKYSSIFVLFVEIKYFENSPLNVCRPPQKRWSILMRGLLYIFHRCRSPPLVLHFSDLTISKWRTSLWITMIKIIPCSLWASASL